MSIGTVIARPPNDDPKLSAATNTGGTFARYAIYWAPGPDSALAAFARSWLGRDAETGAHDLPRPAIGLSTDRVATITTSPARYGLHGTLKAPFRLAAQQTLPQLEKRLAAFARAQKPFDVGPLMLRSIDGFLALCPQSPSQALQHLAIASVAAFDDYRAALTDQDRARRDLGALSEHQRLLLEDWGYPYVFSEFRFHITLTHRLSDTDRAVVQPALAAALAPILAEPMCVDALTLFGDPGAGAPFRVLARYPFRA